MGKTKLKRSLLSNAILFVLIAVIVLSFCGCDSKKIDDTNQNNSILTEATDIGEGENSFVFEVVNGSEKKVYNVKTDKTIVGEALAERELVSGDEGEYGLYVKTVDGVTADYDKDGTYWSFYIDGEYAMSGVDKTEIQAGKTYTFKVEK